MSLATRCNACGTVFRVVPDQLKVSDGWVRCGRCSAVFNAQASLFELEESASTTPLDGHPQPPADGAGSVGSDRLRDPGAAARFDFDLGPPPATPLPASSSGWDGDSAAPQAPLSDLPAAYFDETAAVADTRFDLPPIDAPAWPVEPSFDDGSPASVVSISDQASAGAAPALQVDADEVAAMPSFMQAREPALAWRRPAARRALLGLAVLLGLALLAQAAGLWRDNLAAHVPTLRPLLASACEQVGCRIQPPRRIDQLSVDASGLTHIDGAPLHRLSLTLRNRADVAVASPAIELTLTDVQGQLMAKRVMPLSEFGVAAATLGAGAELPLQALLSTGDRRISGYTVELFYP